MSPETALSGEVRVDLGGVTLQGDLQVPESAKGLVLFAHGSGSSRHSPRNQFVAERIRDGGVGTLLFDLMSLEEEEADRVDAHLRFDIPFLADRLLAAATWARGHDDLHGLHLGFFGSSTGGGAALVAAAERPDLCRAVVSRGGRPDLAMDALARVQCPVLLIVGSDDRDVLAMNQDAKARMECPVELAVIPGATHLFEEPGALEQVADHAARFFAERL